MPRLSSRAAAVDFSGFVRVRVFVNPEGKVVHATAISGHPLLLADCETSAYYSTFSAQTENGRRVSFFTVIKYPFGTVRVPKTISGGVLNGKAISLPRPAYPAAGRAVRAGGAVSVQVLIDESGNVISANAVSGHPLLQAAAVEAALAAKFAPLLLSGVPVKVSGVITYNFVLGK
ncbi:MAG: TonB family protein [Ferruginibacter sp.]